MFKFYNNMIYFFCFLLSLTVFGGLFSLGFFTCEEILYFEFILLKICSVELKFYLLLDFISSCFGMTVGLISWAVLLFSLSYMSDEKCFFGFHLLVLSFVVSMFLLIFSPSLVSAMIGWDGLGLSSYLLVLYYSSGKSYNSAMITALSNRVGDGLLLISIFLLFSGGEWDLSFYSWNSELSLLASIVMVGSTTKSAQIPFSAWLPAAMAAPTPVSALVHSSTLVTAGVYLLIRHWEFFMGSGVSGYLGAVGGLTMFMASLAAFFEMDMKKMVALSTLSQLGVMILALGIGATKVAYFHLLSHAFFKALLFIAVGNMIHSSSNYQDLRFMGGSALSLPVSLSFTLLSSFSLCGLPFMSAFFSKELVLESVLLLNNSSYIYFLMILGVVMTSIYSFRFVLYVFILPPKSETLMMKNDSDLSVVLGMSLLMLPGMLGGWILSSELFFILSVSPSLSFMKVMIVLLGVAGVLYKAFLKKWIWGVWSQIYGNMWLLPFFSSQLFVRPSMLLGLEGFQSFDRGLNSWSINSVMRSESALIGGVMGGQAKFIKIVGFVSLWGVSGSIYLLYLCMGT